MDRSSIFAVAKNPQTRAVVKTVTWRALATIITGLVVYLYTGKVGEASKVTLTAAAVLTAAYYIHEKIWLWLRGKQ